MEKAQTATGAEGNSAQDVLDSLSTSITSINTDGKYPAELENLTEAIGTANTALDAAKGNYIKKGGTSEVSDLKEATAALEAASEAYSDAIKALNDTLGDSKLDRNTTIEMLNTLKEHKAQVEQARLLLEKMRDTANAYNEAAGKYKEAQKKSQSANDQYAAAEKAVLDAEDNLKNAQINQSTLTSADWKALTDALAKAQETLTVAKAAKDAADEEEAKAKQDAEDARDAYEKAAEDAVNPDTPDTPGTPDIPEGPGDVTVIPDTDVPLDAGTVTLEDQAVPLAGLISREILVSFLYTHEGSPDGVDAEGEYTLVLAWAVTNDIVDEEDDPEEVVTVAILREVMTRYAAFLGVVFDVEIEGEDDAIVMNYGEILTAFYARLEENAA